MKLHKTCKKETKGFKRLKEYAKTTDYIYTKTVFKNAQSKIIIICKIHGEFETLPYIHYNGSQCPRCANITRANGQTHKKISFPEFIEEANKKFNYNFKYTLIKDETIIVKCPIHGEFNDTFKQHLSKITGCAKCSASTESARNRVTTESFIIDSKKVHGNKFGYSKVNIKKGDKTTIIECPIHGFYEQLIHTHKHGFGCRLCHNNNIKSNIYKDRPTTLYYIKINNLYKIGITLKDVYQRYKYDKQAKIQEIIFEKTFEDGEEAYATEQEIILKFKDFKYYGKNVLGAGNTELFNTDIREKLSEIFV